MPGQFNGANLKQGLITAAPMFNAMAAGYSSGRGPYAYMDQGAAMMQEQLKMKRDQEAAAAAAAAFQGLTPGGMGAAGGRSPYGGSVAPVTFDKNAPQRIGDDTMAALGKQPLSMEGKVRSGLVARGLPEHVADAFVVNFKDESNLNPGINEAVPLVPGSRGGFGLAQWTGPRRVALERYAESKGKPASDLDVQLDFLVQELQGPEAGAASAIMSAKNAPEAAAAILNDFLRPAEAHRARREAAYLGMEPGAAPVDPMADPYVQQLMQVMAMPGLAPEKAAVVQMMLQSRIETLTTPQPGAEEEAARAQRARDADLLGYERGSPEWRQYVVTGEMPEAPKPGYTRMTPEQVATIPGLDPAKAYQVSPEGKIEVIGGSLVNVDMGGPTVEPLGTEGQILVPDPTAPGGFRVEVAPGSKMDRERKEAAATTERREDAKIIEADVIINAADRARTAHRNLNFGAGGTSIVAAIPGIGGMTDSGEVVRQVAAIKANGSLAALQAMRANSPTGGALGNSSDKDLQLLADKAGALDPNSPNLERDLDDYERALLRTLYGPERGDAMFEETRKAKAPTADDDLPTFDPVTGQWQ